MLYELFFEFYGRKMRTTVEADTEKEAIKIIRRKVEFVKVSPVRCVTIDNDNEAFNNIMKVFGIKI